MSISLKIALRYLFAAKRHNSINLISAISAAGVCVVSAALIIVLSVMNGFETVVLNLFSSFDPDIRITSTQGKSLYFDSEQWQQIQQLDYVEVFSPTIQETALAMVHDKQVPVVVKGVSSNFQQLVCIDSIMREGEFSTGQQYEFSNRQFEQCVLGIGLADQLGVSAHLMSAIQLYAPKRYGTINLLKPENNLNSQACFIAGIFAVNQDKYDLDHIIVSLSLARQLFNFDDNEATAIELRLLPHTNVPKAQRQIQQILGPNFQVLNRRQQQDDFYRMTQIEKLLTLLLLTFILLIATFNIIGSLSMIMIEKQTDMNILFALGANHQQVRNIFLINGWLISAIGSIIGVFIGIIICLTQQYFGWLRLGDGTNYIISAYPVELRPTDIIIVLLIVLSIGFAAAWYATRHIKNNLNQNE